MRIDSNLRRAIQILMLIVLIPIVSIGLTLYQSYNDISNIRIVYTEIQNSTKANEWNLIKSILDNENSEIRTNLKDVKKDSLNAIFKNYDNKLTGLREDMKSNSPDNKLYSLLSPILKDHTNFIGFTDKNNKLWIATESGVLIDNDISSSSMGGRTWEDEISKSHNPEMVTNSINKILNKDTSDINYLDPYRNDHYVSVSNDAPSYAHLEEEFYANGVKSISKYNVVICEYIYEDMDIFGTPDVGFRGVRNHNDTIILGEQYNIGAVLKPYEKVIADYENIHSYHISWVNDMISKVIFNMISTILILLVSIIGIVSSIFLFHKWGGISDGSTVRNNKD